VLIPRSCIAGPSKPIYFSATDQELLQTSYPSMCSFLTTSSALQPTGQATLVIAVHFHSYCLSQCTCGLNADSGGCRWVGYPLRNNFGEQGHSSTANLTYIGHSFALFSWTNQVVPAQRRERIWREWRYFFVWKR
jgi:hypothetical protein